jgi:lipoprotein-anchoring transpeptidase ErfK/SrfK
VFVITEDRGQWLKVQVPSRPQGAEGWVNRDQVEVSSHSYRVEIDVSDRRLVLRNGDEILIDEPVVGGAAGTPTPTGRFYVTDFVAKRAGGSFGPWVLPVSAFSEEMDWFSYGVPVIALHGTNKPQLVGSAASNGCIRMPDGTISHIRETIPLGTPVVVQD